MLLATLSWGLMIDRKTWPLSSGSVRAGGGIAIGVGIVWWWMGGGCRGWTKEKGQGFLVVRVVVREFRCWVRRAASLLRSASGDSGLS